MAGIWTLCAHNREPIFGQVVDGIVRLNPAGEVAREEWLRTAEVRADVSLDAFVIMPNHLHGLIVITRTEANRDLGRSTLGHVIAQFKSVATKRIRALPGDPPFAVWQRNYFDRIIRDDAALASVRRYIANNPRTWQDDEYYAPPPS